MDVPSPEKVNYTIPPSPPPLPSKFTHHLSSSAPPPPPLAASSGIAKSIAALDRRFAPSGLPTAKSSPFDLQPGYFFFYGSLMDPEVLQSVLELPDLPVAEAARIRGFEIRMWGIYPALIPSKDNTNEIMGTFWKVTNDFQVKNLCLYETDAYKTVPVSLITNAGDVIEDARTFIWAGEAGSSDLEDGTFDIERYQKYFKGSVIRARHQ
jgi:hypothetical protein